WRYRGQINPTQKSHVEIADDSSLTSAKTKRESGHVPEDGGPSHGYKTLSHDGEYIFAPHKTAIKKGKPGSHEQYQSRAQECERDVPGIEMGHGRPPFRRLWHTTQVRARQWSVGGHQWRKRSE